MKFSPRLSHPRSPRPVVLHVEDNEARRYSVGHSLKRAGFDILTASTGEEGLVMAEQDPDLIVLDINLPGIDGFEVCRRLKSNPITRRIPILHLSASKILTSDKTQGLDLGADAYLAEPVENGEFVATVKALLRVRQSEEQARALAQRWEKTFAAISDGICVTDVDGAITECNPGLTKLLGKEREQLIGHDFLGALRECFGDLCPEIESVFADDRLSSEVECHLANRWFRVSVNRLGSNGQSNGCVIALVEITALRESLNRNEQLARELQRSNRDLEQFASVVSHDLQEPLRTVSSFVSLLERRGIANDNPQARDYMKFAVEGTVRMKAMIDDLLQYSKYSTSPVEFCELAAEKLVRKALDNLGTAIEEAQAEISVWNLPQVRGDAGQLVRLFQNLIGNAIKFRRGSGPRIRITSRRVGESNVITVADDGIGMNMAHADRIFEIFQRLHQRDEYEGTGVGLAVCKRIVERHGGEISVESSPGEGSRFHIRLPLA